MLTKISKFIIKVQKFIDNLLSDSHSVSLKRFIALCAFVLFTGVTITGQFKTLTADNVNLLNTSLKYLSGIIAVGILGVAATDIFSKKSD